MLWSREFLSEFPLLNKNTAYKRNVVIGGTPFIYTFTNAANRLIISLLDTCRAMGQDPLRLTFEQIYLASAAPNQKYQMRIVPGAASPSQPVGAASPAAPIVMPQVFVPTPRENEIIDAIRSVHSNKAPEPAFVEIMKSNGVDEFRAKQLFINCYSR